MIDRLESLTLDEVNARLADVAEELRDCWDEIVPQGAAPGPDEAGQISDIVGKNIPALRLLATERRRLREGIINASNVRELGALLGWSEAEMAHAESSADDVGALAIGKECVVLTHSGREIRSPPHPGPCGYIRIVQQGFELGYWASEEWMAAPEKVMGAIMGAIQNDVPAPLSDMVGGSFHDELISVEQRPRR